MKKVEEPCDDLIESARYKTLLFSVQQFKNGLDKIRRQEVEKYIKKVSGNERELMERFTNVYIRKIINMADEQVRAMPENCDTEAISMILAELFNAESPFLRESSLKKNSISLAVVSIFDKRLKDIHFNQRPVFFIWFSTGFIGLYLLCFFY